MTHARSLHIVKQEQALASLRTTNMGTMVASDADFCHEMLDLERSLVDALLAVEDVEEKKAHAKRLATACDALKKYAESFAEP